MKRVKRVLALLAALALVLAMAVPAFADGANLYTISVPAGSSHTYKVYQIFTGDYSKEGTTNKLSNVKWGQNSKNRDEGVDAGGKVSENVLNRLAAVVSGSDAEKLAVIEEYADLNSKEVATVTHSNSAKVAPGYYLFKDTTATAENEVYITEVVGDVIIKAKNSNVPGFEKKLKDKNDTTDNDFGD